jgi:hypothetical protein
MKTILTYRFWAKALFVLGVLLYSNAAFANFQICFTKDVSDDGLFWYPADTQGEAVPITGTAYYRFTATKCDGNNGADIDSGFHNIILNDPDLGIVDLDLPDLLDPLGSPPIIDYAQDDNACMDGEGDYVNTASIKGNSNYPGDEWNDEFAEKSASDVAWISCAPPVVVEGGDGCTPGYWKQSQHFDSWAEDQSTLFSEIFGEVITIKQKKSSNITDPTLLEALSAQGGGVNKAARHATAAYLNAIKDDVMYDMTADDVITAFQSHDVVQIDGLVYFNELGCPLN